MPVSPAWEQHVRRGSLRCVLLTSSLISAFQIVFSVDSAEGDPGPMVGLASQSYKVGLPPGWGSWVGSQSYQVGCLQDGVPGWDLSPTRWGCLQDGLLSGAWDTRAGQHPHLPCPPTAVLCPRGSGAHTPAVQAPSGRALAGPESGLGADLTGDPGVCCEQAGKPSLEPHSRQSLRPHRCLDSG